MLYGDLQFFDIIVFGVIAVFLIYRLRSVLGKRTGYQPTPTTQNKSPKDIKVPKNSVPQLKDSEEKLSAIYEVFENFDHKVFLDGAKKAFEVILTAYNQGDKKSLKPLVSKDVFSAFESSIDKKLNNPNAQFFSLVIDGVEEVKVEGDLIKISIKFTSEQIINQDEGSVVKKQDLWTFEKNIRNKGTIWTLIST